MVALVGYTGFVGSNIYASAGDKITAVYNSKNIEYAYNTNPDILIYAGLRAEKFLANRNPEIDMQQILQAEDNISRINPKKLVLISTIDVFKVAKNVDETSEIDTKDLHAYGYNRYKLELWARENYPDVLIIRLPGLFGKNIKKNYIYDFMNIIPSMLKEEKFRELLARDSDLKKYYELQENGFYKLHVEEVDKEQLKEKFRNLGFSALNFTDSRSKYQFYNLKRLWNDIQTAIDARITILHLATEPVTAGEIYEYLTGHKFMNELDVEPADYDFRTINEELFNGKNGYICGKNDILKEIGAFVKELKVWICIKGV